jgi:hypothetical protein
MPRSFEAVALLILSAVLLFFISTPANSQPEAPAVVTFTLDFPGSQPEHYSIRIPSDGAARYQSSGRVSTDSDETDSHGTDSRDNDSRDNDSHDNDSFELNFGIAAETRQKIFELATKAGYFQKDVDSHRKRLAFTGKKTLAYKDAQRSAESTYNYSSIPAVQELTTLLQSLSATLEFGHRLQYDHHYQKLALDEELKRMEEMANGHQLIEIAAIHAILDQIIADPSVMNIARARAQRLLQGTGAR